MKGRRAKVICEWQTLVLVFAVYTTWLMGLSIAVGLGHVAGCAVLGIAACWYMSLQHELLHGHPTASRALNRLSGLVPLAVWYPYDLYRQSHLAHHRDDSLTQPGIDPESNYLECTDYARLPRLLRLMWQAQRTVLGRVLLGPALVIVPVWLDIVRKPLRGDWSDSASWAQHLLLLGALLWWIDRFAGIGPLTYVCCVGYPALGLAMLRSFYEHRPATEPAHRVVVNEAGWFWQILFLNNNYHAVHHENPGLPWYRIAARYWADRARILERNGGFVVHGYGELFRRYGWSAVDSPVHPPPSSQQPADQRLPDQHEARCFYENSNNQLQIAHDGFRPTGELPICPLIVPDGN